MKELCYLCRAMKISASLYSSKQKNLPELVRELDGVYVDYFHIDCNDDPGVFEDIKTIRGFSKTPIDLHIISDNPSRFDDAIKSREIELVTYQLENLPSGFQLPAAGNTRWGLAMVNDTPVDRFSAYRKDFDFVLFMTTTPGKSGGEFNKETFRKIRKFRNMFPEKRIHVDGGVNADVSFVLRNMGVSAVVSGSYLVNAEGIGGALHNLRNQYYVPSGIQVKDFMMDVSEVPEVDEGAGLMDILKSIDDFKLGYTHVVNGNGELKGIISNADIRKGILKSGGSPEKLGVKDLLNPNPVKVVEDASIPEMLRLVRNTQFNVLYLPVVDKNNRLTGAVSFTNLIKGE